jgi:CRP-like cAMP-binding protein
MIQSLLQVIESYIPVSPQEKELIAALFKEKTYEKGAFFLSEGEICRQVGFLTKGLVRYYINDDGEDKTYGFGKENEFVCNYESFVPRAPSMQIIQALEPSEMLVISYDDLQKFFTHIQYGERFGRVIIEQVFIQTLKDRNSFYTDDPESRYEKFLQLHPDLQQRLSQYYIASFVGIKPQSLSRIRKRIFNNR